MTPNEESGYAVLAAFEERMRRRDNADEWRMRMCGLQERADAEKAQRLAETEGGNG